jgi:hypothetical protein
MGVSQQSVDGRMGSKWILGRLVGGGVEWIHLAHDRYRLWTLVYAVMNLRVLAPRIYIGVSNFSKFFYLYILDIQRMSFLLRSKIHLRFQALT